MQIKDAVDASRALSKDESFYLERVADLIASSPHFDSAFYLEANPDVKAAGIDPAIHYVLSGAAEGRVPSTGWSDSSYHKANPDIAAQLNPLLHYELFGRAAGRPLALRQVGYVDVLDKCQLACPNCVRGVQLQKNTANTMPLNVFRAIAARFKRENYGSIGLYSWTEPFLLKTLNEYVAVIKELDLPCEISSNLSHPPSQLPYILRTLQSGVDLLIVSLSGITQATYEVYHKNGRIDWIKANLQAIANAGLDTKVQIRFLRWDYNQHELDLCAQFAKELCFQFETIDGVGHPFAPVDRSLLNDIEERTSLGATKVAERFRAVRDSNKICPLISQTIALDVAGDIYLCCAGPYVEALKIGRYLELSDDEILFRRLAHPYCTNCNFDRRDYTKEDDARLRRLSI